MILPNEINQEAVLAEVTAVFERYETALVNNDIGALDQFFWQSSLVVRFGVGENLYGIEAIRAFRLARAASALNRTLLNTSIMTFGRDFATTTTEYERDDHTKGRQSQTWVRFSDGWRIVSAHVSMIRPAA